MIWINKIVPFVASTITVFIELCAYNNLRNEKQKISVKLFFISLLASSIILFNINNNNSLFRGFLSFLILYFSTLILYQEDILKSFIYMLFCHIIVIICEILFSSILLGTNIINLDMVDSSVYFKAIFSILTLISAYFLTKLSFLKKIIKKLVSRINKKVYITLLIAIFLFLIILDFKYVSAITKESYILNMLLIFCFFAVTLISLYNYIRAEKEVEKIDTLLNFMTKYEKILDEDRINRHEMLNNLLILNSFEDRNTKEYTETLNDLINTYNKSGTGIKNISKLPTGLKGIFYFKLNGLEKENINITFNISKKLINSFRKLSSKEYTALCRIVGITLDNAIEACKISNEKTLFIDIYSEKKTTIIYIENSCKKTVKLALINNKYYSTKGKGRGLGLYLAKNTIENSKKIDLVQESVNKKFITKIIVK